MKHTLPVPDHRPPPPPWRPATLLADLPRRAAEAQASAPALTAAPGGATLSYGELAEGIDRVAQALLALGLARGARVAVWLDKRPEQVLWCFGAAAAGLVFVPVNPLLKAAQVAHCLRDGGAEALLTSPERAPLLAESWATLPALRHLVLTDGDAQAQTPDAGAAALAMPSAAPWSAWLSHTDRRHAAHRLIDGDMAAILYTSGSTGSPKGVVLSHRNLVVGAASVAQYLDNRSDDTLLAVLPLSFDAGFSQLTTAFHAGARAVLLNHLLPRDVPRALAREQVTGLTAVPPLYSQIAGLADSAWPEGLDQHLRYFASTGGRMPAEVLQRLRQRLPRSQPVLMYGLTEAFRSTYLPPEEVDRRPGSIGRAIPNAEVLVLRDDGTPCAVDEPGELVHRGPLVALGYWGDAERTAQRYRPLPKALVGEGLVLPELAVWSGDTVRRDADGYLYFLGRRDEQIKSSGYRISPNEIETAVGATGLVDECVAFGVDDAALGQVVHLVANGPGGAPLDEAALRAACRAQLPAWMVPAVIHPWAGPLPRNPNGKFDRPALKAQLSVRGGAA